jgi:hypothetical protein
LHEFVVSPGIDASSTKENSIFHFQPRKFFKIMRLWFGGKKTRYVHWHVSQGGHLGWAAELIIERNLPLVTPNKPQKNWINRPRRLSYNWRKPNVYGHRRIGDDIMPQTYYDHGHNEQLVFLKILKTWNRNFINWSHLLHFKAFQLNLSYSHRKHNFLTVNCSPTHKMCVVKIQWGIQFEVVLGDLLCKLTEIQVHTHIIGIYNILLCQLKMKTNVMNLMQFLSIQNSSVFLPLCKTKKSILADCEIIATHFLFLQ